MLEENFKPHLNIKASNILLLLCIAGLVLWLTLLGLAEINDPDIFFHIKSGEYIWQTKGVSAHEPFSYVLQGREWINHEWLFQLLVFSIFKSFGLSGLFYFRTILLFAIFWVLFLVASKKIPKSAAVFILFLLTFVIKDRFFIRPELFTLLFLSFYLYVLLIEPKKIIFLPLLQVLWANMHGYYILGPIIVGLFFLHQAIISRMNLPSRSVNETLTTKGLGRVFAFVLIACLLNPNFIRGLLYPIVTAISAVKNSLHSSYYVSELGRPITLCSILKPSYLPFKIAIALTLISFILRWRNLNPLLFILWILALGASIIASRHSGIFGMISFCSFIDNLSVVKQYPCLVIFLSKARS